MALRARVYGNDDAKISPYLKAWIAQPDSQRTISSCVVGVIGEGTSRSLQANWESPFEQSNLGSVFGKVGDIGQASTQLTSVTTLSSTQVWGGNRPHTLNLVLRFYALSDAKKEVADALRELEKMMGPDVEKIDPGAGGAATGVIDATVRTAKAAVSYVKNMMPRGRIPDPVVLCIGARMIITDCVIESMEVDLSKERTSDGYPVRADANLTVCTKQMLTKNDIDQTWFK